MKLNVTITTRQRGIMLTECLVYIGISAVLIGLALLMFLRCMGASTGLTRNVEDVSLAINLGERWRADLRRATDTPGASKPGEPDFIIPIGEQQYVIYRIDADTVLRWETGDSTWSQLIDRVKFAAWNAEPRNHVVAWHFDIELKTKKPNAKLRPQFSFIGVAARPGNES